MGAGALSIKLVVPFPIPAHQTRRADFPHRAFRPASSSGPRSRFRDCFTRRQSCLGNLRIRMGLKQAFANVPLRSFFDSVPEVRALCSVGITRLQRSYGPVRLPVPAAIPSDGVGTMLHRRGVSLCNAICLPGMPCSLPRWTKPLLVSVASRLVLPSPFPRRVGVHDFAFEACSSFTRVTACRVARPPYSGLCHEASTRPVTRPGRSLATMFTDNYMGGAFPHWQTAPVRRTRKFW